MEKTLTKKTLLLAAAVFLIFGMIPKHAHAQVVFPPAPFGAAGTFATASAIQGAAVLGSAAMFSVFIWANTTGEKPFEKAFKVVDYSYPQDPKSFEHIVVEDGVRVGYAIPNSQRYPYKDKDGIHYPKP
jgi:hypothetical protein